MFEQDQPLDEAAFNNLNEANVDGGQRPKLPPHTEVVAKITNLVGRKTPKYGLSVIFELEVVKSSDHKEAPVGMSAGLAFHKLDEIAPKGSDRERAVQFKNGLVRRGIAGAMGTDPKAAVKWGKIIHAACTTQKSQIVGKHIYIKTGARKNGPQGTYVETADIGAVPEGMK